MEFLTERDIKVLRDSRKKVVRYFVPTFFFVVALFHLATVFWRLSLSARIARLDNLTLSDIFRSWFAGIDINSTYSGSHILALEKIGDALLGLLVAFMFFTVAFIAIIMNGRFRRMLSYIDSKEASSLGSASLDSQKKTEPNKALEPMRLLLR